MATLIRDIDRILTAGGKIVQDGQGRFAICRNTGSLVLELDVIGTHFPALSQDRNDRASIATFRNIENIDGSVEIDYADGTGFHDYPFKTDTGGSVREVTFFRFSNNEIGVPPTPANISRTGDVYYPLYFYQDLPLPSGTVDDFYDHHRVIKIRFQRFADLKEIALRYVGMYGMLSEAFGRLRNLDSFVLEQITTLTGISGDIGKIFGRTLFFSNLGFSLGTSVPEFILNSSTLENVSLANMLDLSGDATSTRLDDFLNALFLPNLNSFNLSNCEIDYQIPDLQNNMTGEISLQGNSSPNLRLSPDLSRWQCSRLLLNSTQMPASEYQRILENGLMLHLQMTLNSINVDFDLSVNNTTLKSIQLRNGFGGFFPTFLSKLTVLEDLEVLTASLLTGWGTAGVSPTLKTLIVDKVSALTPTVPTWFTNLTSWVRFDSWSWETQTRMDDHVDSFYAMVEANAPMTGTGIFRGLDYRLVDNVLATNTNVRPTGTYQAPSGYVQGSANGTPANQMEKIYVLVNQYEMVVSVLNATGDGIDIYTP